VDEIQASLRRVLGRHQDARGQLNEYAACAYFESFGYKAQKANPKLDARKIDVIATRADETIYAQVKLGSITTSEMRQVVMSVSDLVALEPQQAIVAIFATSFPNNSEFIRRELEKEFGLIVMCIQLYQMLNAVPEYKRMLKGE
jgi:Holliday junction resolvase-like predicted endonuclease